MKQNKPNKKLSGIKVCIDVQCDFIDFSKRKFVSMISRTASKFRLKNALINFAVVDNKQIIKINRIFLKSSKITDVISFDLSENNSGTKFFDIVINAQLAQKTAKKKNHPVQAELALYFLHGLLHQLGFDDIVAADAVKMHKTEDRLLTEFGYGKVFSGL